MNILTAAAAEPVVAEIQRFQQTYGRRPCPTASTPAERKLGSWLDHRRRARRAGTIDAGLAAALDVKLPGWDITAFPITTDRSKVAEAAAYFQAHGRWPSTTRGTQHERLGTWMQSRRREARQGTLDPAIAAALAAADPMWAGSGTGGRPRRSATK